MLCWFLPYKNANQSCVYIYISPLLFECLSAPPISPLYMIRELQAEFPVLYSNFSPPICFTHFSIYLLMLLDTHTDLKCVCSKVDYFVPLCPSPQCVHKFILYICIFIPSLKIGSSVPFFQISYIQYLFFLFLSYFTV